MSDQTTLRDTLEAAFNDSASEPETQETQPVIAAERVRDEAGRFVSKDSNATAQNVKADVATALEEKQTDQQVEAMAQRPTTWKKDYLTMWDKMTSGQALTPQETQKFLAYVGNQRENEYKTGVSTYRQEAENAKQLIDAMTPFLPELQKHGIQPQQWISNLGNAHRTLAAGTPEQKLQMFARLAQDYGVPLHAITQSQQGGLDPIVPQLMAKIQELESGVKTVSSWREQQEQQALHQEIQKYAGDTENYPYFEQVRETMAGLLQAGLAQDLPTAYAKAVRMNDEVWKADQDRLAQQQVKQRVQQAAQAKAKAVSVKSSTPTGQVTSTASKGLRGALEQAFDEIASRV